MPKPLKIWKPKEEKPPEEPQLFVDLRATEGSIELLFVDESGKAIEDGAILWITTASRSVTRYVGVNPALGLDLDQEGRVNT